MSTIVKTIGRDLPRGDYVEITLTAPNEPADDRIRFFTCGRRWHPSGTLSGRERKRLGHEPVMRPSYAATVAPRFRSRTLKEDGILEAAPEVQPMIAVQTSDFMGAPPRARELWTLYAGPSHDVVAIGEDGALEFAELPAIVRHARTAQRLRIEPDELPHDLATEADFVAFVDSLADEYARRAERARACIAALVDLDGVEGEPFGRTP